MGHYDIFVEMKDKRSIPKDWLPVILKICAFFGCNGTDIYKDMFVLRNSGSWYDYRDDFKKAAQDGLITRDVRSFYKYAKKNMNIYSDCSNPSDVDYGPRDWEKFEKNILDLSLNPQKDTIRQIISERERNRRAIFHVHTYRCGHAGNYSDREYIERALVLGADKITFTDHAPFPGDPFGNRMRMYQLPEYIDSMKRLKEEYKDSLNIVCGLEIEYLPSFAKYYEELRKMEGIEYMLIGQHFYEVSEGVYGFMLPPSEKNNTEMDGCGKAIVAAIKSGLFDGVAHPDRIFRRRKIWDEDSDHIANEIVTEAWRANIPLEINESSLMQEHQFWPEFWSWTTTGRAPVLHGIDAHSPDELKLL